jgi:hypothetical protein
MPEGYKDKFDYLDNNVVQWVVGGGWIDWEMIDPSPAGCKQEAFEEGSNTPGIPPWIKSPDDVLSATAIIGTDHIKKVYSKFKHSLDPRSINANQQGHPAIILASAKVDLRDYIKAMVAYDIPVSTILMTLRDEAGIDKQTFMLSKEYLKTNYHEMSKAQVGDDLEVDNYPTNPSDSDIKRIARDMDEVDDPPDAF